MSLPNQNVSDFASSPQRMANSWQFVKPIDFATNPNKLGLPVHFDLGL
ncbi:hypothetical protein [Brucella rhizosphaerae]